MAADATGARQSGAFAEANDGAEDVREAFEKGIRFAIEIAVCAAIGAMVVTWVFRAEDDWFVIWLYPVITLAFVVELVLYRLKKERSLPVELAMFATGAFVALSRLVWRFWGGTPIEEQMIAVVGGLYWAIVLLMIGSFLVLGPRRGPLVALAVLVASAVVTIAGLLTGNVADGFGGQSTWELARVQFFMLAVFVAISAVAVFQQRYLQAVTRSELLNRLASVDPLTGAANRRAAESVMERRLAEALRHDRPLSLILFDLDHFKAINDTHGHAVGDAVLCAVVEGVQRTIRASDLLTRWGGEEFLIVCPETDAASAAILAERCRQAIAVPPVDGVRATATFGVAEVRPGDTVESLLHRADKRLYRGKEVGRDRVVGREHDPEGLDDADTSVAPESAAHA